MKNKQIFSLERNKESAYNEGTLNEYYKGNKRIEETKIIINYYVDNWPTKFEDVIFSVIYCFNLEFMCGFTRIETDFNCIEECPFFNIFLNKPLQSC